MNTKAFHALIPNWFSTILFSSIFKQSSCTIAVKPQIPSYIWYVLSKQTNKKILHTCMNKNQSQTLHIPTCLLSVIMNVIMTSHHSYVDNSLPWPQLYWHRGLLGRTGRSCKSSCCLDAAASDILPSQSSSGRPHFITFFI